MDDRKSDRTADAEAPPASETDADADADDLEGHSATIYRRRRGPYPLRHGAPLPDADDRSRGERQPPPHRTGA